MYKTIKKFVPNNVKNLILKRNYDTVLKEIDSLQPEILLYGVPEHGNLGDQAIAEAEMLFLKEKFPNKNVVEVPFKMVSMMNDKLQKVINSDQLIIVTGGGYMGSVWRETEEFIQFVVKKYPKNKIIVFPQTSYYEDTKSAINFRNESLSVYNSHKNLTLVAREKSTYKLFNKYYPNSNNILAPDIALYLQPDIDSIKNEEVLFCIRNDREKINQDNHINKIKNYLQYQNINFKFIDTVINRPVFVKDRRKMLELKFEEFTNSKLIVTDRLHGMIFATIVGTPCIALNNSTNKVKGVYEWISNYNYVHLVSEDDNLEKVVEKLLNISQVDKHNFKNSFNNIFEVINNHYSE